ncbi:Uncharacterised protein [Mycobacterium tuberculosis]|nr:Uncharacterised protein [Mycobacterium tuberculosis]COV38062.1 Uncharacterised protein [Mycobacterium tuberculosis]COX26687.1 Uncharacterised protein [Mycobacterium tuberculosis]COY34304.1 Uncharacterised protein [Mycobacterium tuberculosis]
MVMPFSRSRSPVSITRSCSSPRSRSAPDCRNMASTRVVLPWSTCATMATLRNGTTVIVAENYHPRRRGAEPINSCLAATSRLRYTM